jgi:general secretion pathway protein G
MAGIAGVADMAGRVRRARTGSRARRAFTLVEILIVVIILGILAAIVIPAFGSSTGEARLTAFATALKVYARQFQLYHERHELWPADVPQGVLPPEMTADFSDDAWTRSTPIGGQWDWDYGQFGVTAAVSVYQPSADIAQMQKLDAMIDDGDLNTGNFRARTDGYMFVIMR